MSYEELLKKWEPVLEHPEFAEIKDPYKKKVTAILLENQDRDMEQGRGSLNESSFAQPAGETGAGFSSGAAAGGPVAGMDPVMISMIRRSMPNLVAFDMMGVQQMSGPTGLIFAMRSRYEDQGGNEALFDEVDSRFSAQGTLENGGGVTDGSPSSPDSNPFDNSTLLDRGGLNNNYDSQTGSGMSTSRAERLGTDGDHFRQMSFSIEKVAVTAISRALKAEYTMELAQDLKAVHNLDVESELASILSTEIMTEINREMIRKVNLSAKLGAQVDTQNKGVFDLDVDSNGRWMGEKFKGLMFQIERDANAIAKDTRRGRGNMILCSSDVASALQMAGVLDYSPALANSLSVDDTGSTFAGILNGKYKVYIDPYAKGSEYYTIGYKGSSQYDAGLFYCPYVPLQMVRAVGENSFQPKIGFKTRYVIVANPFAEGTDQGLGRLRLNTNRYYRRVKVSNLM